MILKLKWGWLVKNKSNNGKQKTEIIKALKKAIGTKANLRDLAETCVCFANAQGGEIIIGIWWCASELTIIH